MSARKRVGSASTPRQSIKPNPTLSRKLPQENPSIPSEPVDPYQSQRYMQHKLDMAYNKYIQNLALQSILTKTHKDALKSCDEQLVHYEEMYENAEDEFRSKKGYLEDISTTLELDAKLKFLETAMEDIYKFMDEKKIVENIDKINENLELICNNLKFENLTFVDNNDNYNKLESILKELSEILGEINEGNSEDFSILVDNIFKSKDLITKLKQNYDQARHLQNKFNKLVLKTASFELSKNVDDEMNVTPI